MACRLVLLTGRPFEMTLWKHGGGNTKEWLWGCFPPWNRTCGVCWVMTRPPWASCLCTWMTWWSSVPWTLWSRWLTRSEVSGLALRPSSSTLRPPRSSAALSSSTRSMMVMVLAPSWLVRRATPESFAIGMETQNRGLRRWAPLFLIECLWRRTMKSTSKLWEKLRASLVKSSGCLFGHDLTWPTLLVSWAAWLPKIPPMWLTWGRKWLAMWLALPACVLSMVDATQISSKRYSLCSVDDTTGSLRRHLFCSWRRKIDSRNCGHAWGMSCSMGELKTNLHLALHSRSWASFLCWGHVRGGFLGEPCWKSWGSAELCADLWPTWWWWVAPPGDHLRGQALLGSQWWAGSKSSLWWQHCGNRSSDFAWWSLEDTSSEAEKCWTSWTADSKKGLGFAPPLWFAACGRPLDQGHQPKTAMYKFMNIVFDDKVQSELIIQDPVSVPEKIETLDVNTEVKKIVAASLSAVALSTVKPAENTPEFEEKNKLLNEIKEFVQLKALRLQAFCASSKKGVRDAEGPSLKTLGMPSAPLPAYFNEDEDDDRYVRDDVENVRDDSREDDGVRSTTLDGIDLGDLPPQGRAFALHPEEVQLCEPPVQDRALAFDPALGEPALHDRALASSASAAVLGDLPQQARALAAAAVLGELAEQDLALASSNAAGLGALHPERALHGADAASSGALGGQLGALPVLHPGEEEPRLLPLQAEVPAWNQNVPEISGGDTVKSAELAQIEKGIPWRRGLVPEEEPSELLPERDLHGPVWLSCTGPLGSTNVAGKPAGWKKEAISEIDSAKGTVSSVQLGVQIQSEKHGDWKGFSPSVIQQPKGPHNFSFSSVFPSVGDDEKMKKNVGMGGKSRLSAGVKILKRSWNFPLWTMVVTS